MIATIEPGTPLTKQHAVSIAAVYHGKLHRQEKPLLSFPQKLCQRAYEDKSFNNQIVRVQVDICPRTIKDNFVII